MEEKKRRSRRGAFRTRLIIGYCVWLVLFLALSTVAVFFDDEEGTLISDVVLYMTLAGFAALIAYSISATMRYGKRFSKALSRDFDPEAVIAIAEEFVPKRYRMSAGLIPNLMNYYIGLFYAGYPAEAIEGMEEILSSRAFGRVNVAHRTIALNNYCVYCLKTKAYKDRVPERLHELRATVSIVPEGKRQFFDGTQIEALERELAFLNDPRENAEYEEFLRAHYIAAPSNFAKCNAAYDIMEYYHTVGAPEKIREYAEYIIANAPKSAFASVAKMRIGA